LGGRPRRPADGRQGGRPWDRRTHPDVRRTWPWTSVRVTTLNLYIWEVYKILNLSVKINDDIYEIL
jgi:hypothetical protein